jgi:hypothetical protein
VLYAPDVNEQVRALESGGTPVFIRRLKEMMLTMDKKPIFTQRRSVTTSFIISEMETDLYRAVSKYVSENFNMALKNRRTAVAFALKVMQKRLLSSSHAIYRTLEHRAARLQEILDNDEFKKSRAELEAMERQFTAKLELEWEDMTDGEREKLEKKILQLSMAKNPAELREEISLLEDLQVLAKKVVDNPDQETKIWELKKLLDNHLKDPHEKIIIFTEFKDTLEFITEQLSDWGYSNTQIHGGMDKSERVASQERFRSNVQVLVATEAAGEGINLQFCHLLINFDIPWTPTRVEQRLGRIHRYGQKHDCFFFNLVSTEAADGKPIVEGQVLDALLRKIEAIRESLNDRVFDIIGNDIFRNLSLENVFETVISDPDGFFKIKAQIESGDLDQQVEDTLAQTRENITINLPQVFASIDKSKDARLWPEYVEKYVTLALDKFRGSLTATSSIHVPADLRTFDSTLPSRYDYVTFTKPDPAEVENNPDIAYIAPGHTLLETFIDFSINSAGEDLYRGAIFMDPMLSRLGLLWCLEQGIDDGTQRAVGKTIGLVFQPLDEDLRPLDPEALPAMKMWDFEPVLKSLQFHLPFSPREYQSQIETFFRTHQGKDYFERLRVVNERLGNIRKEAAKTAYDHQRGFVSNHILQLRKRLKKSTLNEKTRISLEGQLTRARNERDQLETRFQEQQLASTRQNTITPRIPRILGVAMVVPANETGDVDMPALLDISVRQKRLQELADKRVVDEAAMNFVTKFETEQRCCQVTPTANINCGYDLESVNPADPTDIRRIEVKGHRAAGATFISNNELTMGLRHGDSFWLYVVEYALSESPRLRIVQNPALKFVEKLNAIKSTKFILSQEDLENNSEIVEF